MSDIRCQKCNEILIDSNEFRMSLNSSVFSYSMCGTCSAELAEALLTTLVNYLKGKEDAELCSDSNS